MHVNSAPVRLLLLPSLVTLANSELSPRASITGTLQRTFRIDRTFQYGIVILVKAPPLVTAEKDFRATLTGPLGRRDNSELTELISCIWVQVILDERS